MKDNAAAGVFAFLIAGGLFLALVGGILIVTQQAANSPDDAGRAIQQVGAKGLVDVLAGSPGIWTGGADNVERIGLQNANGSGLDLATLALMRGGTYEATANGLVDYDEAKASLGLGPNEEFYIRVYPTNLVSYLETMDLSHVDTAYIGHWIDTPDALILPLTPAYVQAQAQQAADDVMGVITSSERDAIVSLGTNFNDAVYLDHNAWNLAVDLPLLPDIPIDDFLDTTLLDGDVYPDDKSFLNAVLPGRLAQYDLLIVGSGIDQSSLTSNVVKDGIRDWTLAGGTLVVLGSDAQNFQWLQPLFGVGTATVNGGAYAPDVDHPVLHAPHELSWSEYNNNGLGWDIKDTGSGAHYDDFQHVIVEDGEDILAISLPGAFGTGRIFLTSYQPGAIADELGIGEAAAFLENIVIYDDRDHLYLDFGPQVPDNTAITAAIRTSHVWDDALGQVPVRVEVLYWTT